MDFIELIKDTLPIMVIAAQALILLLLALLLLPRSKKPRLFEFLANNAFLFSFIVALTATAGSLFYSEVAGFTACLLCWWQRIFMYPQVILLGLALWKDEKTITDYVIALSSIGALIGVYHYFLQIGVIPSIVSCSAVGYSVNCASRFVMDYGYITIPMMSITAFLLIILLMTAHKKAGKKLE